MEEPKRGAAFQKPLAVKLGVFRPITVYPLYESATSAHWGQTPREALAESGELWSTYSASPPTIPIHGRRSVLRRTQITTPTPDNRLIAWPYTKLMVANPSVNMGGAVLMTSLAKARAAGVPEDKLVYPLGGASAEEPRDYLLRDQFYESHPQNAVLNAVMDLVGGDGKKFDAIELYSCFPCVPKMARRTLGLGRDVQPTVTGGLTFFGAPLNTYMTHAACAMVRKIRSGAKLGLLYGQGGFVTKHHGLVLSREMPREAIRQETSVQAEADRNKRAVPEFVDQAGGKGKVEAFTVIYRGNGEVEHGVVMLRTEDGRRTLATHSRRRRSDAGASARHGPHAGRLARRHHDGGRRRAGVAGGVKRFRCVSPPRAWSTRMMSGRARRLSSQTSRYERYRTRRIAAQQGRPSPQRRG